MACNLCVCDEGAVNMLVYMLYKDLPIGETHHALRFSYFRRFLSSHIVEQHCLSSPWHLFLLFNGIFYQKVKR